jgi:hypothetical protein
VSKIPVKEKSVHEEFFFWDITIFSPLIFNGLHGIVSQKREFFLTENLKPFNAIDPRQKLCMLYFKVEDEWNI